MSKLLELDDPKHVRRLAREIRKACGVGGQGAYVGCKVYDAQVWKGVLMVKSHAGWREKDPATLVFDGNGNEIVASREP